MKPKLKIIEKRLVVYRGITAEAKRLGISRTHIRLILDRNRIPGDDLREKLERNGYQFDAAGLCTGVAQ